LACLDGLGSSQCGAIEGFCDFERGRILNHEIAEKAENLWCELAKSIEMRNVGPVTPLYALKCWSGM